MLLTTRGIYGMGKDDLGIQISVRLKKTYVDETHNKSDYFVDQINPFSIHFYNIDKYNIV